MGAIVSHRKNQRKISRVEQKAKAVNAFTSNIKEDENSTHEEEAPVKPQADQSDPTTKSTTNIAVASWGEGIVGTSSHELHNKGMVSSRGVQQEVKSSMDLYPSLKPKTPDQNSNNDLHNEFAKVAPIPRQPSSETAATTIQRHMRGYQCRKSLEKQQESALIIQRYVRGYQSRKGLEKQQQSALTIQRKYRNYKKSKPINVDLDNQTRDSNEDICDSDDKEEEYDNNKGEKIYRKAWREPTVTAPVINSDVKIGEKTQESFNMYQEDITDLKWKTEQQLEMTTMGDAYVPPRIVVIASNIPRADVLETIVKDDVFRISYDFYETTLQCILDKIEASLETYQSRSRARSIAFVCQGGPGYFNPVKGKVVTKAKVQQDIELSSFWTKLGTLMTKLDSDQTTIHFIGNNVTGNKKGEQLMKFISKAMHPSKVKVESPLELGKAGREMLALYFDFEKYKVWKSRMYSKVSFTL